MGYNEKKIDRKKEHYLWGIALDEKSKRRAITKGFQRCLGYKPNFENPKTMNEKIAWLKLYYQDPLITTCCDKFAVKEYVAEKVGAQYVVPTIESWEEASAIDFDKLPEKFVLKVNWSSGYNIIVPDKTKLDQEAACEKLQGWMEPDRNSYYHYFNWGYKHMKPVIYAEDYIEQIDGQVYDYKFYFNHGNFLFMFIATDRFGDNSLTYNFFDSKLQPIPCTYGKKPTADPLPEMPKQLEKMLEIAAVLAEPFPFVRVDFYEVGSKVYVGEMTFYSGGGILPFDPPEWDLHLGAMIPLPQKKIIEEETFELKLRIFMRKIQIFPMRVKRFIHRKISRLRRK